MSKTIGEVRNTLDKFSAQASWQHKRWLSGCIQYAKEMFEFLIEPLNLWRCEEEETAMPEINEEVLLNGAKNWVQYSRDGNSLIFNKDICHRLCDYDNWEFFQDGKRNPRIDQDWLDVQAKALRQASRILLLAAAN